MDLDKAPRRGRYQRLAPETAAAIGPRREAGESLRQLANEFGIGISQVVTAYANWRRAQGLTGPPPAWRRGRPPLPPRPPADQPDAEAAPLSAEQLAAIGASREAGATLAKLAADYGVSIHQIRATHYRWRQEQGLTTAWPKWHRGKAVRQALEQAVRAELHGLAPEAPPADPPATCLSTCATQPDGPPPTGADCTERVEPAPDPGQTPASAGPEAAWPPLPPLSMPAAELLEHASGRERARARRLAALVEGRLAGASLQELAQRHQLTKERVRQLLKGWWFAQKLPGPPPWRHQPDAAELEELVPALVAKRYQGLSLAEIAGRYRTTAARVEQLTQTWRAAHPEAAPWPDPATAGQRARSDRMTAILEQVREGKSRMEIAAACGLTYGSTCNLLLAWQREHPEEAAAAGLTTRERATTTELETLQATVRALHAAGHSQEEIAATIGRSVSHVGKILLDLRRQGTSPATP